jgi:hypothetical protein
MARTLSIHDDETGVTASMRVVEDPHGQRITSLRFDAADGHGINASDLHMLTLFGLELPTTTPGGSPAQRPQQRKEEAAEKPASTAAAGETRRKRYKGGAPSDAALQTIYTQHGGSAKAMADSIGCATTTVHAWINAARKRGVQLTGGELPAAAEQPALPSRRAS